MQQQKFEYYPLSVKLAECRIERLLKETEFHRLSNVDCALLFEDYGQAQALSEGVQRELVAIEAQRLLNSLVRKYFNTTDNLFFSVTREERARLMQLQQVAGVTFVEKQTYKENPSVFMTVLYKHICTYTRACESFPPSVVSLGSDFDVYRSGAHPFYKTFERLQRALNTLGQYGIRAATLQGSFGSRDALIGWSDLDLVLLLHHTAFNDPHNLQMLKAELKRLSLIFYKVDSEAHHEFIYLTELDTERNIPSLFPTALLQFGVHLVGATQITTSYIANREHSVQVLFRAVHYFRKKVTEGVWSTNYVEWKDALAHLFILPSLALQAKGVFVFKRDSFSRIKREFPDVDTTVLDVFSHIRMGWKSKNILRYYPDTLFFHAPYSFNRFIFRVILRFLRRRRVAEHEVDIAVHTKSMLSFGEALLKSVVKNYD